MISRDPIYLSAKASTYYWRRQIASGRTDEVSKERLAHWTTIVTEIRKRKGKRGGRAPGQLNKSNPMYVAPLKIKPARMPKVSKEVVQKEREEWIPVPLSWD
jgi:hypothetical protein